MEKLAAKLKEYQWNLDPALDWPEYHHITKGKGYILVSRYCPVTKHATTLKDVKGFLKLLQDGEMVSYYQA